MSVFLFVVLILGLVWLLGTVMTFVLNNDERLLLRGLSKSVPDLEKNYSQREKEASRRMLAAPFWPLTMLKSALSSWSEAKRTLEEDE